MELRITPEEAQEILNRAGIRPKTDLGQRLQDLLEQAEEREKEQFVNLTDRETAQLLFPFLMERFKDIPQEKTEKLFNEKEINIDTDLIYDWPENSLPDEEYEGFINTTQDELQNAMALLLMGEEGINKRMDAALDQIE